MNDAERTGKNFTKIRKMFDEDRQRILKYYLTSCHKTLLSSLVLSLIEDHKTRHIIFYQNDNV